MTDKPAEAATSLVVSNSTDDMLLDRKPDTIPSPEPKKDKDQTKEEQPKVPVRNFARILAFGGRTDHVLLLAATAASLASGVAIPLMQIIFGNLVRSLPFMAPSTIVICNQSFRSATDSCVQND